MTPIARHRIVVLGMMSRHPVAGVVWQTMHYLVGLQRLGYDVYYLELGIHPSSLLADDGHEARAPRAAAFLARQLARFGLEDRWAFHDWQAGDRSYGLSEARLRALYETAAAVINLHGATWPLPGALARERLVYLETDPVVVQIQAARGEADTLDYLSAHGAHFTFGENYGAPDCRLPVTEHVRFRPTRQPVVLDLWDSDAPAPRGASYTTVGNWRQRWRDVHYDGEVYRWSKHYEFLRFLDLPRRTPRRFELAMSGWDDDDRQQLRRMGWHLRESLDFSLDLDAYRAYIQRSRGEFTVAKDQNVRLRSGWFSDRSATYLAAGRPVITQETGFSNVLPSGRGLFAFSSLDEILAAVDAIDADRRGQERAARDVARTYFDHRVVLSRLLEDVGITAHRSPPNRHAPAGTAAASVRPGPYAPVPPSDPPAGGDGAGGANRVPGGQPDPPR